MNVYLVSDIEGSCGFTIPEEGVQGAPCYAYFARQMALEAAAACRGAHAAGASGILVHDAHDTARNIDPTLLPEYASIMRRSGADPYAMLSGLQSGGYDALLMTGFHAWAGSAGSPASHTFNHRTAFLSVNDLPLSEFLFNAYSAASLGVPTPFVSGDEIICRFAEQLIPAITAVRAVRGVGGGSVSRHPAVVLREIEQKAAQALAGNFSACMPKLPAHFRVVVRFFDHIDADFNSYYPGMQRVDDCTLAYEADDWYDILLMVHCVLARKQPLLTAPGGRTRFPAARRFLKNHKIFDSI